MSNEENEISLETLKQQLQKHPSWKRGATFDDYDRWIRDVLACAEKLQKQIIERIEKDRRKMGADLCYWQDVREILGLEKETSK